MALAARPSPDPVSPATAPTDPAGQLVSLLDALRAGRPVEGAADDIHWDERPYRDFLNALDVAVYSTDEAGRITFFNDAAATFWGRRPELGELWCGSWRLYWPDGRPMRHDECPMAVALHEDRPVRGEDAVAERPDGTRVAFAPFPTPLHDATGRMVGAVNVLVDVSERRRAEQALREAAEDLQASNAVKDEFLGLISHELRTPVTTIFGNAQLLRDRGERLGRDQRQAMTADIAADSERLMGIVENLLLLTRMESGPNLEPEPLVADHVIRESIESFRRRHDGRTIVLRDQAQHVLVEADSTYVALIMENLLSNADKYSPADREIEVVVRCVDDHAEVLVRDRGIGLSEREATHLFTPFYRTATAKRMAGGVGIGLAACRRLVEALGGRIWSRRRRGGGTEFGFSLPLVREAEESGTATVA